jgi:hypothetical protein
MSNPGNGAILLPQPTVKDATICCIAQIRMGWLY